MEIKNKEQERKVCPKCHSLRIYFRKWLNINICYNCHHEWKPINIKERDKNLKKALKEALKEVS